MNLSNHSNISILISFKLSPISKVIIDLYVIKSILKALKIKFQVEEEKSYNPKFVERVLTAKEEIKQVKGVNISTDDLWK